MKEDDESRERRQSSTCRKKLIRFRRRTDLLHTLLIARTLMKTSLKIVALFSAISLASISTLVSGCAGTSTRQSTGEYVDDAAITTKVKAELVRDDTVKALQVNVDTFKGVVQLSGFVDTAAQKSRAGEIARTVNGVTDVKNNIEVKPVR